MFHIPDRYDERIASVFQIEFEPLGRKDGCPGYSSWQSDKAEFSSRKIPPIRPLPSRATQKPSLLRPMKNAGIASLTMPGSSG
jgi:hypothetical protein